MAFRSQEIDFTLRASKKRHSPVNPLILAPGEPCQTYDIQNYKIINCVVLRQKKEKKKRIKKKDAF